VLCASIGVAVAEKSGFLAAVLRAAMVTCRAGCSRRRRCSWASARPWARTRASWCLPPLAAAVYRAAGRSAALGHRHGHGRDRGGFNANLFLTSQDPLLAGMTEQAARILDPGLHGQPGLQLVLQGRLDAGAGAGRLVRGRARAWLRASRAAPRWRRWRRAAFTLRPEERRGLAFGLATLAALLALLVRLPACASGASCTTPPRRGPGERGPCGCARSWP
jgi:aminobenzoyl-glutamate transport protein